MTWNYRVIGKTFTSLNGEKEVEWGIYEAYYENKGDLDPTSWSENPVAICGSTFKELREAYERYGFALNKPALFWDGKKNKLDKNYKL